MLQNKSFVKKTRKGAVVKVVREHYLRDDLPTGSKLDPDCPADQQRLGSGDDTSCYLVIDTNVALHQLDFLENKAIEDVVVCSTVLEEARARDKTSYDRLRSLTSNSSSTLTSASASNFSSLPPRRFFAFANEHHRETYVGTARPGESPNDRNDRAVRRVAGFYASKFPGVAVVLLTDDRGCRAAAVGDPELKKLGVRALSCREYAQERSKEAPELADLVASAVAERRVGEKEQEEERAQGGKGGPSTSTPSSSAAAASPSRKRARIYSEHRPLSEVAAGLKSGTLWQGCLRVSRFNKKEAWVKLASSGGGNGSGGGGNDNGGGGDGSSPSSSFSEILIKGELAMNRAFDGDIVAVRLLPREQWSGPDERIPGGGGGKGAAAAAGKAKNEAGDGEEENDEDDVDDDDGARIALADLEADGAENDPSAAIAATAAPTQSGSKKETATGVVVAVIRRSWRARGYPALLLPPKPGTDAAAALLRCSAPDASSASASTTTTSRPIYLLAAPMDRKLPLIRIATRQAASLLGSRVVVAVDGWPSDEHHPLGHYKSTLGKAGDKAAETAALLLEHDVKDSEFSDAVLGCVPRLPWSVEPERDLNSSSSSHREDWRDKAVVFSVDPPGCRDIDDALHVTRLGADDPRRKVKCGEEEEGGAEKCGEEAEFELGVHIADVSHFVRPSTPLDAEACSRGTSTYLVDRRLDMLPKALTEDICSLRSGVDRLTFSCVWTVDSHGRPAGPAPRFFKAIIKSRAALTYAEAQARIDDANFVDEGGEEKEEDEEMEVDSNDGKPPLPRSLDRKVTASLKTMFALTKEMRARRSAAGALELASPEVRFELADDETNDPIDAGMYQIRGANRMVRRGEEEFCWSFFFFCRGVSRFFESRVFFAHFKKKKLSLIQVEEMMLAANVRAAEFTLSKFPAAAMLRRHPEPPPKQFAPLLRAAASAGVDLRVSTSKELAASLDGAVRESDPYFNKLLRILATRCMTPAAYYASGTYESAKERRHYGLAAPLYTHFTSPIRR